MRTRRVPQNEQQGARANMFSHVMIGTNDLDRAKSFYDAVLGTLGTKPGSLDRYRIFWRSKGGTFSVTKPIDGKEATCANGGTIGFAAESTEAVDAFHAAGIANGGTTCENPPGIREGRGHEALHRLSARSLRQQDLRPAPDGVVRDQPICPSS